MVDHGHLWLQRHVGVHYYQSIICQPEVKPGPALPVENDVSFFNFCYLHVIVSTKAVNIMDHSDFSEKILSCLSEDLHNFTFCLS